MEAGRFAAGSGRAELPSERSPRGSSTPFLYPCVSAPDEAADERLRVVDLHRERVVLRRSVRGVRMALNLPVAAFRGVAIRMVFVDAEPPTASRSYSNTAIRRCRCRCLGERVRRHRCRVAVLGPRARIAAPDRGNRRQVARTVRAGRRASRRGADMASPPPQRHGPPAAEPAVAARAGLRRHRSCIATSTRSSQEIEQR